MRSLVAVAVLGASLALAACSSGSEKQAEPQSAAEPAAAPAASEPAPAVPAANGAAAAAPGPEAAPERWLLQEFDWGDSEDTVYETIDYTDGFLCYRHKFREHCAFVKTKVDGDELLARFSFVKKRLWRIDVLTPDLNEEQADQHLERIWKVLVGYVTRFKGEAPQRAAFPQWKSLAPGAVRVTNFWKLPEQEIRIVVGRSDAGWYTAARFVDPKWSTSEPAFEADAAPAPQAEAAARPPS